MPPTRSTRNRVWSSQGQSRHLSALLLVGVLLTGIIATPTSTGAWFTAAKSVPSNSLTAARLQPVSGLSAVKTAAGVNLSWTSALQQPWASSNSVGAEPTYAVTRTLNGQSSPLGSTTNLSITDPYSKGVSITPVTYDAGSTFAGYVKNDGSVMLWGYDENGALGNGQNYNPTPQKASVPDNNPIISIAFASSTAVALSSNGSVWMWGYGALGCGGIARTPVQATMPNNVSPIAVSLAGDCTLLVLDNSGTVWARSGSSGQTSFSSIPLPGGLTVKQLTKSRTVLATDGTVWGWGPNSSGRLGNGTRSDSDTPVKAQNISLPIAQLSADASNVVALADRSSTYYAWGDNRWGQVGNGYSNFGNEGLYVTTPTAVSTPGVAWVEVQVSNYVATLRADDYTVWAMGSDRNERLGTDDKVSDYSNKPQKMPTPSGITPWRIFMGESESYYFDRSSSDLYGWGLAAEGGRAYFGNNDSSTQYYKTPKRVRSEAISAPPDPRVFCKSGENVNSDGYCVPTQNPEYSVSYKYQSWLSGPSVASPQN